MKILFIGTVEFSKRALQQIVELGGNVVGVCTKESSAFNNDYADLTTICQKYNLAYQYVEDINSAESIHWINKLQPDIIFCFGWSSLIKKELLNLAPMGVVGFHPAELPKNRGRHPIIWALALGLETSASSFFFMDEGADSGDILSQEKFSITFDDNAMALYEKITTLALGQIRTFLPKLQNNTYQRMPQDHSQMNIWRKRTKKDGEIDFRMGSLSIYNLIRALSKPYVGAHVVYNGQDCIIWSSEIVKNDLTNIESGKILEVQPEYILVKTYDGAIKLTNHEFQEIPKVGEYL